jgi:hypothetical protein
VGRPFRDQDAGVGLSLDYLICLPLVGATRQRMPSLVIPEMQLHRRDQPRILQDKACFDGSLQWMPVKILLAGRIQIVR